MIDRTATADAADMMLCRDMVFGGCRIATAAWLIMRHRETALHRRSGPQPTAARPAAERRLQGQ